MEMEDDESIGGGNHKGLMIEQKKNFFLLPSSTYVSAAVRKVPPISVFSVFKL